MTPIISTLLSLRGTLAPDGTQLLREAIVRSGSATDDNLQCSGALEFGFGKQPGVGARVGVKLLGAPYVLSDVADAIESIEFPSEIREYLPGLTEDAWAAATRLITLLVLELETFIPGGAAQDEGH